MCADLPAGAAGPTPGPWTVVIHDSYPRMAIATVYSVTTQPTEDGLGQGWVYVAANVGGTYEDWHGVQGEEGLANARLIASAPDLLAALQGMVDFVRLHHDESDEIAAALLAKAEAALSASRPTPTDGDRA